MSRLGEYIELIDNRNSGRVITEVKGININKEFIPTVVDAENLDIEKYKIVKSNEFAYSGMQTGRDNAIRVVLNESKETFIISPAYLVFRVKDENTILSKYLMIYFKRHECDRRGAFMSDGSIRSNLDWDRFCDIEINVPSIEIQKKYVAIYDAMKRNLKAYETGLEDLKLVCDGYIEKLRKMHGTIKIREYIREVNEKNTGNKTNKVLGISKEGFISPKQEIGDIQNYYLYTHNYFVYNPARINVGSIGLYKDNDLVAGSPIYVIFKVIDENKLNPDYLMMWLKRSEFLRGTDFYSIESVRNNFSYELMSETEIAIPDISIQKDIVKIYKVYEKRKEYHKILKDKISKICPILIKASLSE